MYTETATNPGTNAMTNMDSHTNHDADALATTKTIPTTIMKTITNWNESALPDADTIALPPPTSPERPTREPSPTQPSQS